MDLGYSLYYARFALLARDNAYFKWMGNELKCFLTKPICIDFS